MKHYEGKRLGNNEEGPSVNNKFGKILNYTKVIAYSPFEGIKLGQKRFWNVEIPTDIKPIDVYKNSEKSIFKRYGNPPGNAYVIPWAIQNVFSDTTQLVTNVIFYTCNSSCALLAGIRDGVKHTTDMGSYSYSYGNPTNSIAKRWKNIPKKDEIILWGVYNIARDSTEGILLPVKIGKKLLKKDEK